MSSHKEHVANSFIAILSNQLQFYCEHKKVLDYPLKGPGEIFDTKT